MMVQYPGYGQWVLAGISGQGGQEQDCFLYNGGPF